MQEIDGDEEKEEGAHSFHVTGTVVPRCRGRYSYMSKLYSFLELRRILIHCVHIQGRWIPSNYVHNKKTYSYILCHCLSAYKVSFTFSVYDWDEQHESDCVPIYCIEKKQQVDVF